jgi:hypothetical protein
VDSGGNCKVLVKCRSQCRDNQDLPLNALKSRGLWPSSNGNGKPKFNIIEVYDYHDPAGKMVYQVCRTDTKEFPQRRPDPAQHGKWIWNLKGVTRYPYRLPELLKAETAYFVEGEKDVNQLMAMRFTATTSPEGAGNYRKEFNPYFKGKAVVIFPDNDPPGKAHAQDVARNLHDVAASVKVVELPGLPEKGDVSDWIKAGGTKEQLLALVEVAPELDPANLTPQSIEEPETDPKPTQQDILLTIASVAELFHTPDEDGYGIIPINDHRETWPIRSKGFRRWLSHEFFKSQKKGPQPEAVSSVLQVLEAQAQFDGPERPVWVRIAEHDGAIYLDLGNDSWEAIKITKVGWEVVTDPPVCFRRTRSMMALPYPAKGGTFNELRPFLNAATDDGFFSHGGIPHWSHAAPWPISGDST